MIFNLLTFIRRWLDRRKLRKIEIIVDTEDKLFYELEGRERQGPFDTFSELINDLKIFLKQKRDSL